MRNLIFLNMNVIHQHISIDSEFGENVLPQRNKKWTWHTGNWTFRAPKLYFLVALLPCTWTALDWVQNGNKVHFVNQPQHTTSEQVGFENEAQCLVTLSLRRWRILVQCFLLSFLAKHGFIHCCILMKAAERYIFFVFILYLAAYISQKSIKGSGSSYIFAIHVSPAAQVCKHLLSAWRDAADYFQTLSGKKTQTKHLFGSLCLLNC